MSKINSYATQGTPVLADKLIGTDTANSDATKNFTIGDILSLQPVAEMYMTNIVTDTVIATVNVPV